MLPRLLVAAFLAFWALLAHSQPADPNLQNLLAGLMNGTPVTGYGQSAAGGSAPALPVPAREQAIRELAAIGIINPSEDQIRTALVGGSINTVNGVYQLPGVLPR